MLKSVSHIFGGEAKVKIMRLFVFNPNVSYTSLDVATRIKEKPHTVRRELGLLLGAGLIKKRPNRKYILNQLYPYLPAVSNFLIDAAPMTTKDIIKKISRAGSIKLVLIAGVFLHDKDSRVDILVVGDHLSQAKLVSAISAIEAELGKELRYATFETADFNYRLGIYDKLIRDIFDARHEKIIDKLGVRLEDTIHTQPAQTI